MRKEKVVEVWVCDTCGRELLPKLMDNGEARPPPPEWFRVTVDANVIKASTYHGDPGASTFRFSWHGDACCASCAEQLSKKLQARIEVEAHPPVPLAEWIAKECATKEDLRDAAFGKRLIPSTRGHGEP